MFPSFLLAKMYIKGSLKNTQAGFEFGLKNFIDSTILVEIGPISADNRIYLSDSITLWAADQVINAVDISRNNPLSIHMGKPIRVAITGNQLPTGTQKISVSAASSDIGRIYFDICDNID